MVFSNSSYYTFVLTVSLCNIGSDLCMWSIDLMRESFTNIVQETGSFCYLRIGANL